MKFTVPRVQKVLWFLVYVLPAASLSDLFRITGRLNLVPGDAGNWWKAFEVGWYVLFMDATIKVKASVVLPLFSVQGPSVTV